jgi:hypothetical protein
MVGLKVAIHGWFEGCYSIYGWFEDCYWLIWQKYNTSMTNGSV